MLDSFSTVSKELNTLQQKLKTAFPVEEVKSAFINYILNVDVQLAIFSHNFYLFRIPKKMCRW